MQMSPILSPSGEPVFTAGGNAAYKVAEYRGFVASLEWARRRRKSLCMLVIWPASNILTVGSAKPGMWAISRNVITDFVGFDRDGKCTGGASDTLFKEALEALPMLGKDRNDKQAFLALVDTVVKFAPDLVHMPVAPKAVKRALAGEAMWEVTAKNKSSGKVFKEAAV